MSVPTIIQLSQFIPPRRRFGGVVPTEVLAKLADAYDRYLQRRALAELDDRMLRDVGLSRADVEREISKPFWR